MALGFSNYLEQAVLEWIFKRNKGTGGAQTLATAGAGTTIQISLHTTDPGDTGGAEVGGGVGYTRFTATTDLTDQSGDATHWNQVSVTGNSTANKDVITFGPATGGGWSCSHVGVWDSTGAIFLLNGAITGGTITVGAGVQPTFAVGALTVALD